MKERTSQTGTRTINALVLDARAGDQPKEPSDVLAEAVMKAAATHYRGKERSGPKGYAIGLSQDSEDGSPARRFQLFFKYDPDEHDAEAEFDPTAEEGSENEKATYEALLGIVSQLRGQMEALFDKTIELVGAQEKMQQPLVHLMVYMGQVGLQGWHMQMEALRTMWSHRESELEMTRSAQTRAELLEFAKPAVKTLMNQGGMWWMMRKAKELGLDPKKTEEMLRNFMAQNEPDEPAAEGGPETTEASPPTTQVETEAPEKDPNAPRRDIVEFATAFAHHIRAPQWRDIADLLTKRELAMFAAITEQDDDEGAVCAYEAFATRIPQPKLAKLASLLDEEQQKMMGMLMTMVNRWKEWEAQQRTKEEGAQAEA